MRHTNGSQTITKRRQQAFLDLLQIAVRCVDFVTKILWLALNLNAADIHVGQTAFRHGFTHVGDRHRLIFFKIDRHGAAARKVDVEQTDAALVGRHQTDEDQHERNGRGRETLADEIDVGRPEQPHHAELGDDLLSFGDIKNDSRAKNRREHTHRNAQDQRHRKSFDLLRADPEEHERCDQRR